MHVAGQIDLDVRYRDTSGWCPHERIGETTAAVKTLVDSSNDTIVGAPKFGPEYSEFIKFCALAVKPGLTTPRSNR